MYTVLQRLITTAVLVASFSLQAHNITFSTDDYDRAFPIWGKEARELGHELPKPYGLSFNYMTMDQPLVVDSIKLTGLPLGLDDIIAVDTGAAEQNSATYTLRGDVWILPFFNVYGILGYTKGESTASIFVRNAACDAGVDCFGIPGSFPLEFEGPTYGAGTTLVGGIGNWFAMVDANYTNTRLNILDGEISSIVVSPRVGYRTKVEGHNLQMWVGAMYQKVDQSLSGNLKDIGINIDGGRFEVEQHLEDQWNGLIGAQYQLTEHVDLLMEGGIGTRRSFMMGLGYRF